MLNQSADCPLMTPRSSALELGQELGQGFIGVYVGFVCCLLFVPQLF